MTTTRCPALLLFVATVVGAAGSARAAIAPECAGVERPADYDEERQQAWLQNYFSSAFLLTPMAPAVPYEGARASVGLELGFVPPVSCERRLVLDGTKTEQTNGIPFHPRPRLLAQLPDLGPVASMIGFTFLPPVPTPLGTVLEAGIEAGVGTRTSFGLELGARGHMTIGRVRTEMSTPLDLTAKRVDDLFFSSTFGLDASASWRLRPAPWAVLAPYASLGAADITTLFIVGDDRTVVENVKYPWWGATAAVGAQALFLDEHLEVVAEGSAAFPHWLTVKTKVALVW